MPESIAFREAVESLTADYEQGRLDALQLRKRMRGVQKQSLLSNAPLQVVLSGRTKQQLCNALQDSSATPAVFAAALQETDAALAAMLPLFCRSPAAVSAAARHALLSKLLADCAAPSAADASPLTADDNHNQQHANHACCWPLRRRTRNNNNNNDVDRAAASAVVSWRVAASDGTQEEATEQELQLWWKYRILSSRAWVSSDGGETWRRVAETDIVNTPQITAMDPTHVDVGSETN